MSDEKLDLILNVVTDIKTRQEGLEQKFDNLSNEFTDFKKQVAASFAAVQNRFTALEKQMVAIGVEVKEEIKVEIRNVNENIDRLEKEILFARSDSVDTRVKVRELEMRLTKLENHIGIAV